VKRRVVLVDDHELFLAGVRSELGDAVEVVGEAASVAEAVPLIKELDPDVVLLDVHLPDLDGFEVARRLRQLDPAPEVVLTSSRDDYASLVAGSAARAFVRKDALSGETLASALA
jgi:DNA-binding NarL/FixJ family response regulator